MNYQDHLRETGIWRRWTPAVEEDFIRPHMSALIDVPHVSKHCVTCADIIITMRSLRDYFVPRWFVVYQMRVRLFKATVQRHLDQYVENAMKLVNVATADGPEYHRHRAFDDWLTELVNIIGDAEDW